MSFFTKLFGDPNKKVLAQIETKVKEINDLEPSLAALTDEQLQSQTLKFKQLLAQGKSLEDILPESFATVREASKRVLGLRHFDVQLMGAVVLNNGQIAEMKTGEGKTLTSTLAVYLNALTGEGVHVVTVNDYLAARDAVWMGQIYDFLGLTVSCIQNQASFIYDKTVVKDEERKDEERDQKGSFKIAHDYLRPCLRKQAYETDITYGTNNEFGFDYLRDNMAQSKEDLAQRKLSYAIIDEVDSILIDEARTPLIISAPAEKSTSRYSQFASLVRQLTENEDYNIDEKMRSATLTENGIKKMEKWLGVENIYVSQGLSLVHHIEQALKAHTLFKLDKDYVVKDGEIVIVDEFTGRLMPGRRYSEGLHQAIEAKEGVRVQQESQTLATITFQNYFRLYKKLAGMTGTAATEAEEFANIYKLEVVVMPTNKQMIRQDLSDKIYKSEKGKFSAVVKDVAARFQKGQPVLIGTISIEKNELLAALLQKEGIPCQVLNAKHHEKEAQIIAQAGRLNAVTVATNMAGRGVDIILGGNPCTPEESLKVKELGGLHIIGTERHESRRIDNQLRGRSGRQGDPGSSQFYLSMEDDLMRIFGSERMKMIMEKMGVPDDMPIENKIISRSIEAAQKKVEGNNFDARKHVLEYDDVLNKHRDGIYGKRHRILESQDNKAVVMEMLEDEIEQVISFHTASENKKDWNLKEIAEVLNTILPASENGSGKQGAASLLTVLQDIMQKNEGKLDNIGLQTKIIEYFMEEVKKAYNALEEKIKQSFGSVDVLREIEKSILLRSLDTLWVEHLDAMHHLRIGIGLRGYGQRDPLIEYKKEAFRMFNELQNLISKQVVYTIFKLQFEKQASLNLDQPNKGLQFKGSEPGQQFNLQDPYAAARQTESVASNKVKDAQGEKIGRNDPCPCGSGKKYKKCHGK